MAYVRNWLHCVWGTKSRIPFLRNGVKKEVLDHIKANAKLKGIYIDIIDGHSEHLHCLISLHPDQALSDVMRLIKGESSFWINKNHITRHKFSWAVEYFAVSVSDSHVPRVRNYIRNQEEHHRKKTWEEEYNEYIKNLTHRAEALRYVQCVTTKPRFQIASDNTCILEYQTSAWVL